MDKMKKQCVKLTRKDSFFKIKSWKIDSVKRVREMGGREYNEYTLRSPKTKMPLRVDDDWLKRFAEVKDC